MNKVSRPTLLINKDIAKRNIVHMAEKANLANIELVPHFKTHQSLQVGSWFKEEGVKAITVSSVSMAEYFATAGWKQITIAFPVNILEIDKIKTLAAKVQLTLLVTSIEQIKVLLRDVDVYLKIFIEIDAGSNRSGLDPVNNKLISEMILLLENTQHHFKGFYSHFGHTYGADSRNEVEQIYSGSMNIMKDLKLQHAYVQPSLSVGDTPSSSIINNLEDIKSLHAGNFAFYDLTQVQIGSCREEDIAIALACPVVSKKPERQEIIIYGGGVHLSKESLFDKELEQVIFGRPVLLNEDGWTTSLPGCYVRSLSQEHGVVKLTPECYDQINIGSIIGVLPVHSCMTADAMCGYVDLTGENIDHFKAHWSA